jgi:protein phosphatase
MGEVIVHAFGRTDVGRSREHNEDAFLIADLTTGATSPQPEVHTHPVGPRGTLFMVADGLGGAAAGEVASELAVQTVHEALRQRWGRSGTPDAASFASAIKGAAEAANAAIFSYALEHPENRGLGTTATIAGLLGDTLYVAQVGDSRAYLVRDGIARQITKDQSLMQRLVEAGELTPDEAERSDRRNIILQALGPEPSVRIDLTYQQLRRGDTLVLCTDGLSGLVRKEEIARIVSCAPDLETACEALIDRANENGGPDNITVIVARVEGHGLGDAAPDDRVGHEVYPLPGGEDPPLDQTNRLALPRRTGQHRAVQQVMGANGSVEPQGGSWLVRASVLALTLAILLAGIVLAARQWRHTTPSAHKSEPTSSNR